MHDLYYIPAVRSEYKGLSYETRNVPFLRQGEASFGCPLPPNTLWDTLLVRSNNYIRQCLPHGPPLN